MIRTLTNRGYSPIGVDIGSQSVKLIQFNADRRRVIDAARRELPTTADLPVRAAAITAAIQAARESRSFRGREAVLALGGRELFVQNIRLPKAAPGETERLLRQEAANRLPFPAAEAEIRFIDAADVRQGDTVKREVILLACHRPMLEQLLAAVVDGGLKPIAVDVEPLALLRCYSSQFRRDEDRQQRAMFVHIGATNTVVVIARGPEPLFVKYVDVGGRHLDAAVASQLKMDLAEAANLRSHNGDRRADQQDPEIARSVQESTRPVVERLASELAMCVRYHSVTFRGQPLVRVLIGGGEASTGLADDLSTRLDLKCELGDPLRNLELAIQTGRRGQWDLAVGMALRENREHSQD
jgi:type IV pilus assembly protein PilM